MTIRARMSVARPSWSTTRTPQAAPSSRSTSVTRTRSRTSAPAPRAAAMSTASSRSRRMESPAARGARYPWLPSYSPDAEPPSGARTRMPRSQAPAPSSSGSTPMSCRIRVACGLRHSAHGLARGKVARSSTATRAPARASRNAVLAPAGPPPTTTASSEATATALLHQAAGEDSQRRAGSRRERVHGVVVHPWNPAPERRRRAAMVPATLGLGIARGAPEAGLQ
jgi:hypothetical protein